MPKTHFTKLISKLERFSGLAILVFGSFTQLIQLCLKRIYNTHFYGLCFMELNNLRFLNVIVRNWNCVFSLLLFYIAMQLSKMDLNSIVYLSIVLNNLVGRMDLLMGIWLSVFYVVLQD